MSLPGTVAALQATKMLRKTWFERTFLKVEVVFQRTTSPMCLILWLFSPRVRKLMMLIKHDWLL